MKYKEIFAIDPLCYSFRKKNNKPIPKYYLKNYDYYEPKLDKEFYLNYFLRELMFDVKVEELKEFIYFQYDYCPSPDDFLQVIDNEVLTTIKDIVKNAHISMNGEGYYNQIKLEDGFVETESVIKNSQYEHSTFSHLIAFQNIKSKVLKRKKILQDFLKEMNDLNNSVEDAPLKWIAGPAQLGFIISALVQNGYINPPLKTNGTTNFTQLAKDVLTTFHMNDHNSVDSLRGYLNPKSYKHVEIQKHFDYHGFKLSKRSDDI